MPIIIIASPQGWALLGTALFAAGKACYNAGKETGRAESKAKRLRRRVPWPPAKV